MSSNESKNNSHSGAISVGEFVQGKPFLSFSTKDSLDKVVVEMKGAHCYAACVLLDRLSLRKTVFI